MASKPNRKSLAESVWLNVFETELWFHSNISRKDAEKLLYRYTRGTFLIRHSEQRPGTYSLSIRDYDSYNLDNIKHYNIRINSEGNYFIISGQTFTQMSELVTHYSNSLNRLCCRLIKPCPKSEIGKTGPVIHKDEIDRNHLELKRELGTGSFGKVYYGLYKGREVAIKELKPGMMSKSAFLQEANIMRSCRHINLMPLYGICSIGQPFLIVTEYMKYGSLLEYLRENPEGQNSTIVDLIKIVRQVSSGMAYLNKMKIIHRDLTASNVLIGENRIAKIADFGLSRIMDKDNMYLATDDSIFPIKWTSPEAVRYRKFTSKSDVWSFGILLYEIFTKGQNLYPGMENRDVLEQVERGYRMPKPTMCECPNSIYQIMIDCWNKDPEKRPTFEYLFAYFDGYIHGLINGLNHSYTYSEAIDPEI